MVKSPTSDTPSGSTKDDEGENDTKPVGGCAFFLSLLILLPTGCLLLAYSLLQLPNANVGAIAAFVCAVPTGALAAHWLIRGALSVFLHEVKHSIISNLVGNKHKGMKIGDGSGHYKYSYTKETSHYNAMISLAPYIIPLCTLAGLVLALTACRSNMVLAVACIGVGYGADLVLNLRDISPIQTDISLIRGGYYVGILYICSWQILIGALVFTLASQGPVGIGAVLQGVSTSFMMLYLALTGQSPQQ